MIMAFLHNIHFFDLRQVEYGTSHGTGDPTVVLESQLLNSLVVILLQLPLWNRLGHWEKQPADCARS